MGDRARVRRDEMVLRSVAASQGGFFSTRQAAHHGISRALLWKRAKAGVIEHCRTGVYRVADNAPGPSAELFATLLMVGWPDGRAAISHHSALYLWRILDDRPAGIDVLLPRTAKHASRPGLLVHHGPTYVAESVDGLPVTTPARSIVDVIRGRSREGVVEAIDRALARGLTTARDLLVEADGRGPATVDAVMGALRGAIPGPGHCIRCGQPSGEIRCSRCVNQRRGRRVVAGRHGAQVESLASASRTARPWAEEEDSLVLSALPIKEVARSLGRTYYAVLNRKFQLRRGTDVGTSGPPSGPI
jgi:hypothetical protein